MRGKEQTKEQVTKIASASIKEIALEPRAIVWFSHKVQGVTAAILIAIVVAACFGCVVTSGFLLDDFLHIDYAMRALHQDWAPLLSNLTGNWGGSDLMKSYRPVASLSIFLDSIMFRTHAWGYHLSSLLLYVLCCCFVSLITLELTGRSGNRMAGIASLWAGLLFAVYPLHLESVAWIIGRVDPLCTLFYLASVFCFLRFQLNRETGSLVWSLVCFLLALLSKEMAVTLPVVITMAAFLVRPDFERSTLKTRLGWVGLFWMLLVVYSLCRNAILGTTIGGYGESSALDLLRGWTVFFDKASLAKIFVGVNEEYHPLKSMAYWIVPAYVAIGVCLVSKLVIMRGRYTAALLFLAGWTAIALVPTFQIWHIHPNLVGSRLFFLSSAPFCMLLALAALPAVEVMKDKPSRIIAIAGAVSLLYLFFGWAYLTRENLRAWVDAGRYMQSFKDQLCTIAARVDHEAAQTDGTAPIIVLDLPRDNCGAGMITRQKYLDIMMDQGFAPSKASRFLTIEPTISSDPKLMWPSRFCHMVDYLDRGRADKQAVGNGQVVRWSDTSHLLSPWAPDSASTDPVVMETVAIDQFTQEPPLAVLEPQKWSRIINTAPWLEVLGSKLRIHPGSHGIGVTMWLNSVSDEKPIDPRAISVLALNLISQPAKPTYGEAIKGVTVVWQTSDGNGTEDCKMAHAAAVSNVGGSDCLVWLGRYRAWTLAHSIKRIGLHFEAGDRCYELGSVKLASDKTIAPSASIKFNHGGSAYAPLPLVLSAGADTPSIQYSAGALERAKSVEVMVSALNQTFDVPDASMYMNPKLPVLALDLKGQPLEGAIGLPKTLYNEPGYHEIQIRALDNKGEPVGVPSEPIPLIITK